MSSDPLPGRPSRPEAGIASGLFVAVFGLLLGSFPARNPDLWGHLAAGRALAGGGIDRLGPTWLYDLVSYGVYLAGGGAGLVAVKAAAVAALGLLLLRS
ncbi:MAG: hypothetical protein U0797_31015, partial [Gemmataceae bacterium]